MTAADDRCPSKGTWGLAGTFTDIVLTFHSMLNAPLRRPGEDGLPFERYVTSRAAKHQLCVLYTMIRPTR